MVVVDFTPFLKSRQATVYEPLPEYSELSGYLEAQIRSVQKTATWRLSLVNS